MSPSQAIQADIRPAFQAAEPKASHLRLVDGVVEQPDPVREIFYIHTARPAQGSSIQNGAWQEHLLQVFKINAGVTPGQVAAMTLNEDQAIYRSYKGPVGQDGIEPGYVYACIGTDDSVNRASHLLYPRPRIQTDTTRPAYGNHEARVMSRAEQVRAEVDFFERQRQKPAMRHNLTCGG